MHSSHPPGNPRIVIPIVAGIGNALMAVPMVRQLKARWPGARITIIARIDAMGEPFRRMREVEEVLITGDGWRGMIRKLIWTRKRKADIYLVPFPSNRWQYNLLAALSGAKRRVMHSFPIAYWRALGFVRADRVAAVRGLHDVQQNLRLLRALGIEPVRDRIGEQRQLSTPSPGTPGEGWGEGLRERIARKALSPSLSQSTGRGSEDLQITSHTRIEPDETDRPTFNLSEMDRARGEQLLRAIGIDQDTPFVALHAGSGQTILGRAKRWPVEKYAELISILHRELPHRIVLLEGPDEAGVAQEILDACARQSPGMAIPGLSVLRLTGPLGDAAAVLSRAQLYIGSDSGLAHLAASVGTEAVTIFAPADPDRVCPFGYRDLVVRPNKDCSPCFGYPWKTPYPTLRCREPMCVNEVTVDAVMDAVRRATSRTRELVSEG